MSILLKWKNKLQDPSLYETKIREFDERVSHLKNENVELHKRIDQLEALCATSVDTQQSNHLQEHIQQLRQENGRLSAENQSQRQEYEHFLDQLTSMVLRTAIMQENIRKECASIYHVIERISTLTTSSIEDQRSDEVKHQSKRLRSLSWENFTEPCELLTTYPFLTNSSQITSEFIQQLYRNRSLLSPSISSSSSSSSTTTSHSSATTHCSFSTSGSWTLDLSFDKKTKTIELPIERKSSEKDEKNQVEQESQLVLQRSETFIVSKLPQEEAQTSPSPTKPMTTNSHTFKSTNVQRCSTTRTIANTNTTVIRPSRLPSRCTTNRNTNSTPSKPYSSNTNSKADTRSSSIKKVSKLPIRTMNPPTKPITPVKKSNVTTSVASKTKKEATISTSTRAVTSLNNTPTKRIIRPPTITKPSVTQNSSSTSKFRSRSITTVNNKTNTNSSIPISTNKRTRTTPPSVKKMTNEPIVSTKKLVKSNDESKICSIEKMNSTSSESSIEEKRQTNKFLAIVQDEGYSTWSSSDVKGETNSKKTLPEERRRNTGLVKNWLDTSNQRCSTKPVNEVEYDKLEEFTRELSDGSSIHCPFVRTRCSNGIIIPLASTTLLTPSLPEKDISIDSLEGAGTTTNSLKKDSSSSSSSSTTTFSRSETFEKLLINTSLPNITDSNLTDSTDSTSSDLNQIFHLSEYIEDNLLDQTDNCIEPLPILNNKKFISKIKPQKRLMFPGLFNQLIFLRRVLSDSDLRQKVCYLGENQTQSHVYHANAINEHSIELNLLNTYGSESELHVWSHDCAEQRRFLNERQQQQLMITNNPTQDKLSHIERMIRMTLDDNFEDENITYEFDHNEYDQQLALERQTLLQQIYEYPWLLQDDDLDQTTVYSSPTSDQPLLSPSPDLVVPSHNPDFYQLCALTNSSSFATSYGTNSRHTTPPIASSVL